MLALIAFALLQSTTGTFDNSKNTAAPTFKSVGVRGSIDAGGYAASAAAKTQTEFFHQLADLQVRLLHADLCQPLPQAVSALDLMRRSSYAFAVTALEKVLRASPDAPTRRLLGLAYEGDGQLGAAAEQFRIAALDSGNNPNSLAAEGIALLLNGEVEHAESVCRSARSEICTGVALFQMGKVKDSISSFFRAAEDTDSTPSFAFLAIAFRSADAATLTDSIAKLKFLATKSPLSAPVHHALACALLASGGNAAEAEQQLKSAIRWNPDEADSHFQLGAISAAKGDWQTAIWQFQETLKTDSRIVEAHYRLGQTYEKAGERSQAKQELELYEQLRSQQKVEIESGKMILRLPGLGDNVCSMTSLP